MCCAAPAPQEDNDVCIITEFVRGFTLRQLARRHGGVLPEAALVRKVLRPAISALAHLHSNGILHRDIKSDNMVVGLDGALKLLDFGLAIDIREEIANTRAGEAGQGFMQGVWQVGHAGGGGLPRAWQ